MKAILIALVFLALMRPENHMEIWHTWYEQTAIAEEVTE